MKKKSALRIHQSGDQEPLPFSDAELQRIGRAVAKTHPLDAREIHVHFTDDQGIRRAHRKFFNLNTSTDVITFDFRDDDPTDQISGGPDGEILVNLDRAQREARRRHHEPKAEAALYVIHGLLHLVGFDDLKSADQRRMDQAQEAMAAQLGYHLEGSKA